MRDLPEYSGMGVQCPKCLFDDVGFDYHPAGTVLLAVTESHSTVLGHGPSEPEWMLRTCRVCGYAWAETTADGDPNARGGTP